MKYGVVVLVSLLVLAGIAADPVSPESSRTPTVAIQAEGRGGPWLNLQNGFDLPVEYGQGQRAPTGAQPTALVVDDFDADGMPDLVTGYAEGKAGLLVLQRGNPAAIIPHLQTGTSAPFFPSAVVVETPAVPDFLVAGDFDNDGHPDVVTAKLGGPTLFLYSGDGAGGLKSARPMDLAAEVTLLISGDVNRVDRLFELIVGTSSPDGPELRVFESPKGAWNAEPEIFALPSPATAATLGDHDRDTRADIAVATGSELVLIRGRDRKLSEGETRMASVAEARVEQSTLDFEATSIAFGDFTGRGIGELAILASDGTLGLIEGATAKPIVDVETGVLGGRLALARATSTGGDDLIIVEREARKLHVHAGGASFGRSDQRAMLNVNAEPIGVLSMRLNPDALDDLVVLKQTNGPAVAVTTSAPVSTFTVTNTNDSGSGSLRRAINDANFYVGADAIHFNIPGTGAHSIHVLSDLSQISDPVAIDGTTQPGYSGAPLIEVHGTAGGSTPGFILTSGNSTLRGLAINRFRTAGILIRDSGNNLIESNYIGTNLAGDAALPNDHGILAKASRNVVGGRLAGQGNLISGNNDYGVYLTHDFGTNGAADVPKAIPDAGLVTSTVTLVDPTLIEDLNVNVYITHPNVSDLDVYLIAPDGTRIGLSLGNGGDGDDFYDTAFDDDAGIAVTAGHAPFYGSHRPEGTLSVLDGEPMTGIWSLEVRDTVATNDGTLDYWSLEYTYNISTNNRVEGNRIGMDVGGTFALPNKGGVCLPGTANSVGAPAAGAGNLISGNTQQEVILGGPGNVVQRNLIGTDATGTLPVGFQIEAVRIDGDGNLLGGEAVGTGNVVGLNSGCGVFINESAGNSIQGNFVGTDLTGTQGLGGSGVGVCVEGGKVNAIGGTTADTRNLISDLNVGIEFKESRYIHPFPVVPFGNTVIGSYIGTDVNGRGSLGHSTHGVLIANGFDNAIEGDNVICTNAEAGVWIGPDAEANRVTRNRIGVDVGGAPDPGNGHGIVIEGRLNEIRDNVISGNRGHGILAIRTDVPTIDAIVSTYLPVEIPDVGNLGVGMAFSDDAVVIDVDVQIDVDHTYDSDLVIDVFAPDGTQVRLTTNNGGDGDGYDGTLFDDEATLPITEGAAPFSGSYRPEQPLAAFDGIPAHGSWEVWIHDEVAGDVGIFRDCSVILTTVAVQGNQIVLNRIGLDIDQSVYVAAPNLGAGVHVEGAGNRVEHNHIAANIGPGLQITGQSAAGNVVIGNMIGYPNTADPESGLGNGEDGVLIAANDSGAPVGNRIGGEGFPNAFYYNAGSGVRVADGSSTWIRENDFIQNGGLGIDLGPIGVTHNDPLDTDTGPNGLQNFPVITSVTVGATETVVEGFLESSPGQEFIIDLYSWGLDPTGYGEGQWLTSQPVTTSPTGEVPFVFVVTGNQQYFAATATGPDGSTSEFSGTFTNLGATGMSSNMTARSGAGTEVEITYDAACGAIDHAIYQGVGPIWGTLHFSDVQCFIGWGPHAVFDPGDPGPGQFFYFVVVGQNFAHEGSYGQDSFGVERPEAFGFGACDRPQVIATTCP